MCTNGTRAFVPAKCKAAFEQKILARVERIRAGDVFDPQTNFGPLVSFPHRDNVLRYIAKGQEEGARVLCGGDVLKGDGFDNGAWVAPTVFTDCRDEMTIVREEIFGPVMSLLTYESEDEVIRRANDTDYGPGGGHRDGGPGTARIASFISWKRVFAGSTPGANPRQRCPLAATNTPALVARTA